MKSLRDSFKTSHSVASISSVPTSAAPILDYREENELIKLWIEVSKSEVGFRRLMSEAEKYQESLKEVHETEDKLINLLGETKIGSYSRTLCQGNDEYLSAIMKMKSVTEETSSIFHEVLEVAPSQYHSIYEHLETFSKKRDSLITNINKCQEKIDKLKLKGKRTTDLLVEKEKQIRQLKALNAQLLQEAKKFHAARIPFLKLCLQAAVLGQINFYGSVAGEFNNCIRHSRKSNQMKDVQYFEIMNGHLQAIQDLKIVE